MIRMFSWQTALAVLLGLLAIGALLEDLHWAHIEFCHVRNGGAAYEKCGRF